MRRLVLFVLLIFSSLAIQAEMYRWVDEHGKTHFSDKKPPKVQADDISDTVKQQNTDYGSRSAKTQLQQIERNRAARKAEERQQIEISAGNRNVVKRNCEEAQQRLQIIRGRVIFYDKDNKEVKVTEKEREQRVLALEQQIKKYCK